MKISRVLLIPFSLVILFFAACSNESPITTTQTIYKYITPTISTLNHTSNTTSTPGSKQNILLSEDFNSGFAQGFNNRSGLWEVINCKYGIKTSGVSVSTVGNPDWQIYSIEADFINPKEGGLCIGYTDDKSIFLKIVNNSGELYFYWSHIEGSNVTNVHFDPLGLSPENTIRVRIELKDDRIVGYVNDKWIVEDCFSTPLLRSNAALMLQKQTDQYWDNVVIKGINSTIPELSITLSPTAITSPTVVPHEELDQIVKNHRANYPLEMINHNGYLLLQAKVNSKFDSGASLWIDVAIIVTSVTTETIHTNPNYFTLIDEAGYAFQYDSSTFSNWGNSAFRGIDLPAGTKTDGVLTFRTNSNAKPKFLIYDDNRTPPIQFNWIDNPDT